MEKFLALYNELMENSADMALASSKDNRPNVRIVNFIIDSENKGLVYFSTFSDNRKIVEFSQNPKGAFTTISVGNEKHVRVQDAEVKKSKLEVNDIKAEFIKKYPMFEGLFGQFGDAMEIWEISFSQARVIEEMGVEGIVEF